MGLELIKPGTNSTDSECGEHGPHKGLVAGGVIVVLLVMAFMIIAIFLRNKKNKQKGNKRERNNQKEVSVTLNKHALWLHIH